MVKNKSNDLNKNIEFLINEYGSIAIASQKLRVDQRTFISWRESKAVPNIVNDKKIRELVSRIENHKRRKIGSPGHRGPGT